MKILASQLSPFSARLRIACALKDLSPLFEPPPGGSGSVELKQLTPFGRIPTMLLDDGKVLVESLALLEYLEDTLPGKRRLRPADSAALARVRMIAMLFDHNVVKALGPVWVQLMKPVPDVAVGQAAFDEVGVELGKLVHFFDAGGPCVGGELSMADCAMAPFAFLIETLAPALGCTSPLPRVPRFAQWWVELSRLPEVAAVVAGMGKALAAMQAARRAT
jgi:glutathione S-transferase